MFVYRCFLRFSVIIILSNFRKILHTIDSTCKVHVQDHTCVYKKIGKASLLFFFLNSHY